jgi:hypothetical protein
MKRTAAVLSLIAFTAVPAFGQDNTTRIRGTIVSIEGRVLTVAAVGGNRRITMNDGIVLVWVVKSDLSKIVPGAFVGSAATTEPDGTLMAQEVHIFPESMRGTGEGSRPYDLGEHSSMTNGTISPGAAQVEHVGEHTIKIKYKDGEKKIVISADTPIVAYEPADAKALVPGAHVYVIAQRAADGSLSTMRVNIGKDGLVPPM